MSAQTVVHIPEKRIIQIIADGKAAVFRAHVSLSFKYES